MNIRLFTILITAFFIHTQLFSVNLKNFYRNYIISSAIKKSTPEKKLINVIQNGNIKKVKKLVETANLNTFDDIGLTPLMHAIRSGDAKIVNILLDEGADVNAQRPYGTTALMEAVKKARNVDLVEKLLRKGADVHAQYGTRTIFTKFDKIDNALTLAIDKEDIPTIKALLNAGADVNSQLKTDFLFPELRAYGLLGFKKIIETPLQRAAEKNNILIFNLLLPKANKQTRSGALLGAVKTWNIKMVKKLIKAGVNINYKNMFGDSALEYATNNYDILKILLENKANPNIRNSLGITPLMDASKYRKMNIIELLLEYGSKINLQDNDGFTALMYAVNYNNDAKIVKKLLDAGADINIKNKKGQTALDIAKKVKNNELIELLSARK